MWPIEEAIFWSHLPRNLLTTKNTIWAKMRICLSTWVSTLRSRFKRMYFARNLDWWNFIFQMYRQVVFSLIIPFIFSFLREILNAFCYVFIDTTPPEVNCPQNLTVNTDPEMYFATLNISLPNGSGIVKNKTKNLIRICFT